MVRWCWVKFQCRGSLLIWFKVGQGPTAFVGCFVFNGPLRQYFSLYRAVYQRGRKKREVIVESKSVQTTPTRTYCKHNRPLPYSYPNCRTPRHWSLPITIAPHDHPRPTALAVGAGGCCLDVFSLVCHFSILSLLEMARYRLKCCLKGPLSPKQPTNHETSLGPFPFFLQIPSAGIVLGK